MGLDFLSLHQCLAHVAFGAGAITLPAEGVCYNYNVSGKSWRPY